MDTPNTSANGEAPIKNSWLRDNFSHVVMATPFIPHTVGPYFRNFGEVEAFRGTPEKKYILIQFKTVCAAQVVTFKPWHRISGHLVMTYGIDSTLKPYIHPLLKSPEQDSASNILKALNDDCLEMVFKNLGLRDLVNVAGVCIRFNEQAKVVFSIKYKCISLRNDNSFFSKREKARDLMERFGSVIHSLAVDMNVLGPNSSGLHLISRFCSSTLKEIDLSGFNFDGYYKKLRPLFGQIEILKLRKCKFNESMRDLFSVCLKLKVLQIDDCPYTMTKKCITQIFESLEEAHFISTLSMKDFALNAFILLHPSLRALSVTGDFNLLGFDDMLEDMLVFIEMGSKNESVDLMQDDKKVEFEEFTQNISHLKALKSLKLRFDRHSISPFFNVICASDIPIEYLRIEEGKVDMEVANAIAHIKEIRNLEIIASDGVTDEFLTEIADSLPQLKILHLEQVGDVPSQAGLKRMLSNASQLSNLKLFSGSPKITFEDYHSILETVQKRPERMQLVIEVGDMENVNFREKTLVENSSDLQVKQINSYLIRPDSVFRAHFFQEAHNFHPRRGHRFRGRGRRNYRRRSDSSDDGLCYADYQSDDD